MNAIYALRRIAAHVLDVGIILAPLGFVLSFAESYLAESLPRIWEVYAGFFALIISIGIPVVFIGACVALTGWTPGKLAMFLRVAGRGGAKPSLAEALLRETVKAICLGFFFGALYALYGLVTSGRTFYDDWLGLEVDDLRPLGLTEVQKNWRKHMREAKRGD